MIAPSICRWLRIAGVASVSVSVLVAFLLNLQSLLRASDILMPFE